MRKLHTLMTNHCDINAIELLICELPFIKEHFDCILIESVPSNLRNESLKKYLSDVILSYGIDLTPITHRGQLSDTHSNALRNIYANNFSDDEKNLLRYEAAKEVRKHFNFNGQVNNPNRLLYQFHLMHFITEAIKNGVTLVGIEDRSYFPGVGVNQANRNEAIVANTIKLTETYEKCLLVVGASH